MTKENIELDDHTIDLDQPTDQHVHANGSTPNLLGAAGRQLQENESGVIRGDAAKKVGTIIKGLRK